MSPRDGLFGFKMCECFETRAPLGSFKRSSFTFGPKSPLRQQESVRKLLASVCPLQMCKKNKTTQRPATPTLTLAGGFVPSSTWKDGGWRTRAGCRDVLLSSEQRGRICPSLSSCPAPLILLAVFLSTLDIPVSHHPSISGSLGSFSEPLGATLSFTGCSSFTRSCLGRTHYRSNSYISWYDVWTLCLPGSPGIRAPLPSLDVPVLRAANQICAAVISHFFFLTCYLVSF